MKLKMQWTKKEGKVKAAKLLEGEFGIELAVERRNLLKKCEVLLCVRKKRKNGFGRALVARP